MSDLALEEVQANCPQIFAYIQSHAPENLNWEEIHKDLEALNWLRDDPEKYEDILKSVLEIQDITALQQLQDNDRYKIFKLNRVKIFINTLVYNVTNQKDKSRLVCYAARKKLGDMQFFKTAKSLTLEADEEHMAEALTKVTNVYIDLKSSLMSIFLHLDKSFQYEIGKSFKNYLDEQFFNQVLAIQKLRLRGDPACRKIIDEYDKVYYGSSGSGGYSYNYSSSYSSNYSNTSYYISSKENVYLGELDEDSRRHGYGKITYFNGDSYEGNWSEDKPDGLGIYRWRDGGWYEGEFAEGKMNGKGKRVYSSGNVYVGEFVGGKKQGRGEMKYKNGDVYVGEWEDDDMNGEGTYTWSSGDTFTGRFKQDQREGRGTLTLSTGEVYEANWQSGRMKTQTAP